MNNEMEIGSTIAPTALDEGKLTEWVKEPTVLDLKGDLEAATPSHDNRLLDVTRWNNLRNVTGPYAIKKVKGRSSVQPKLIRRQAEWRYSALSEPFLSSDKMFEISPRTFEDNESAVQNEILLNWQFDTKIDKTRFIDEYVRTAVDEGSVIIRLGWERQSETELVEYPVFEFHPANDEKQIQMLQQAMQLKEKNPRGFTELPENVQESVNYSMEKQAPFLAIQTGAEEIEEEKILENKPTLEIMDPANVVIDPSCNGDFNKAAFIICSYETTKAELMKDGRYTNLDSVMWSSNTVLSAPDHETMTPGDFERKDELVKKVVAYEYWGYYDINGDETLVPIVATWIGDVMIRMEENPFPDGKPPFVIATYLPIKRTIFGEPDAELLEDNQNISGALSRGVIDLLGRSANSQQGYAKGFLDVTNKRRFESGQDYEFNAAGGDPRTAIHQHTYPEIPNSALTWMQIQEQQAESISGVKGFAGGVSGEAYGEVAAGIRGVLDAASKREMGILRRLAKGIVAIGNKLVAMNSVFLTEEEVVRVTNKKFITIKREDLKGNFDLDVDISTPEIDEKKASDLGFMFQTIGPNMDIRISKIILAEIARLKKMPVLSEEIKNFEPQPDPLQEQMKQLELQKLQKEIEELDSKIKLNNAKATGEMVDAENEATGEKHKRDMEKQHGQAQGNQALAVTKSLLQPGKEGEKAPEYDAAIGFNQLSKIMDTSNTEAESNIGSSHFDPRQDPSLNQGFNF